MASCFDAAPIKIFNINRPPIINLTEKDILLIMYFRKVKVNIHGCSKQHCMFFF